jgi:hypothetical protein
LVDVTLERVGVERRKIVAGNVFQVVDVVAHERDAFRQLVVGDELESSGAVIVVVAGLESFILPLSSRKKFSGHFYYS